MTENKTKPTGASVEDYIASRANEQQRADCQELMALLQKVTRQPPMMWGPSIVGYGVYRYTYESGRTGEAPVAGFAIRGSELVVYLVPEGGRQKALLSRLGKHKDDQVLLVLQAIGRPRQVGARAACRRFGRGCEAALWLRHEGAPPGAISDALADRAGARGGIGAQAVELTRAWSGQPRRVTR